MTHSLSRDWNRAFLNSQPLSVCNMRWISSLKIELNASVTIWPDLFFIGRTQAYFENVSIQVSKHFTPSLWVESDWISMRSVCHRSWIPFVNVCLRLKLCLRSLYRVYTSYLISQLSISSFKCLSAAESPPKLSGGLASKYHRFIATDRSIEVVRRLYAIRRFTRWKRFTLSFRLSLFDIISLVMSAIPTIPQALQIF